MIKQSHTDVLIDVRRPLTAEGGHRLASQLAHVPGVGRAAVSTRSSRMLLVDYDPERTSARSILAVLDRQGIDARLVGM